MSSDYKNEHDSNPLCFFPVEVCGLIFQHVTGAELLIASEISPSFYNFVAGTKRCMNKIKLKLVVGKPSKEEESIMLLSGRKYEHLEMTGSSIELSQEVLSMEGAEWTSVGISNADFETVNHFVNYVRVFQASVQELVMNRVYIERNLEPHLELPADIQFP